MNAEILPIRTAAETGLAQEFDRYFRAFVTDAKELALREEALAQFLRQGLPTRRLESWKYTDLRVALKTAIPVEPPAGDSAGKPADLFAGVARRRLRLTRDFAGVDAPVKADSGEAIRVEPINFRNPANQAALRDVGPGKDDPLVALNTAMALGGVEIDVPAGAKVTVPLHLDHETFAASAYYAMPRSLIRVGAGAQVTILQSFSGTAGVDYRTNAVTQLILGDGAKVTLTIVQDEPKHVIHVSSLIANLGVEAELEVVTVNTGAALARSQLFLTFAGEKAKANLQGVSLAGGQRHLDTTLVVDHAAPGGVSRELFKAAIDGDGKSVFQGKIVVRQAAQKTDGKMMSRCLLLSDGAEAYNKPELEIFADDVVCGHGTTCGALDEDLLFYCRSRGIPKIEAESLLLHGFLGEVTDAIADEGVREAVAGLTERWLAERD